MLLKWATCKSWERMRRTTLFSSWRAEVLGEDICTVISGMEMSGRSDTGRVKYVITPSITAARNDIITATGLWMRNFITLLLDFSVQRIPESTLGTSVRPVIRSRGLS